MEQIHLFRFPNGDIYAWLTEQKAVEHLNRVKRAGFSVSSEINGVATFYTVHLTGYEQEQAEESEA